jgi:hypothetical protein
MNKADIRILIACEESQRVCIEFRRLGHEAYSCDVQEPSGGHPEWHILGDALDVLNPAEHGVGYGDKSYSIRFRTMDGILHQVAKWDLIIAHPPCTYLSSAGSSRLFDADHRIKDAEREAKGWEAAAFLRHFLDADCEHICVENPAPMHYWGLPPYTQIIQPYQFGHPWKKRTCLWLKGLRSLTPTDIVQPTSCWVQTGGRTCRTKLRGAKGVRNPKDRSKTFPGIARAMAEQWSAYLEGLGDETKP